MSAPKLRHVVLFAFHPGAPVATIEAAFAALPAQIPLILDFEWGTDVSVENIQRGFTHCFFLTFATAEARDQYLVHPAHQAFGDLVHPHLANVLVIDYWANS